VDAFADSAVIIKARIKTRPLKQHYVRRQFNLLMKRRFDELGIEIPFPHQTLYFGTDTTGRAPPLPIEQLRRQLLAEPEEDESPRRVAGER
jgi:small conductance mechanosensitive channel